MTDKKLDEKTANEELGDSGETMSLLDHLHDLRRAIVRSLITIIILFCIAMVFSEQIMNFLKLPLLKALPEAYRTIHFTGPLDVFIASVKVSMLTAVVIGCPIWSYQFWKFLEPGLYPSEKKLILPFAMASASLFFAGICFCFFLIFPMALEFLIGLGLKVGTPIITVNDYLSMLIIMIFGFGIVFETPVVLVLLAVMDIIDAKMLKEFRPFVLITILVLGALLTPPDPISQVAMAVPVYLMYESSILIIRFIKREKKTEKKSAATT